jgi:hypothetical protein
MTNIIRTLYIAITIAILCFNFNREIINVNDGAGWDGKFYVTATQNCFELIEGKFFDQYQFQRILLPITVNRVMWMSNIEPTFLNIILAFRMLNFLLICIAIAYFILISKRLSLSIGAEVIGFCSLFWCFPVLKLSFYYPLLSDVAALSIGTMITYYYFSSRMLVMLLLIFIGSFVFPTFIFFSLLIFFKNKPLAMDNVKGFIQKLILPVAFLITIVLLYYFDWRTLFGSFNGSAPVNKSLFPLSVVIVALYLYFISLILPNVKQAVLFAYKSIRPKFLFLCIIVVVAVTLVKMLFANNAQTQFTALQYLTNIIKQSITNPGISLIAHTAYYGLFLVPLVFFRRQIKEAILRFGYGMIFLMLCVAMMATGSESRQLINFYPLIVVIVLIAIQSLKKE